jgi:hypothetical protein
MKAFARRVVEPSKVAELEALPQGSRRGGSA